MAEIKRVLFSRKMMILFVLMLAMNCVFFALECRDEREITKQGEELKEYIEKYPEFLASVSENADVFSTISIMKNTKSFSGRNIEKTAKDYARLKVIPEYGENRGIVSFSNYVTIDILLIAIVLFAVVCFTDERRKGLSGIVKCTKKGRMSLGLHRICITVLAAIITASVFVIALIICCTVIFGDCGLCRPLQSIPEFKLCPYEISIGGYLLVSVFMKALAVIIIGLLVFVLSLLFDTIPAVLISILILSGHWLMYAFIIPTDKLNFLKFVNVFALLKNDVFFKRYQNLNILGRPVYFTKAAVVCFIAVFMILSLAVLFISSKRTPSTVAESGVFTKLGRKLSHKMPQLPLFWWETKKTLINRKGLIIIAVTIYLSVYSFTQYSYAKYQNNEYDKMYQKYSGVVTEELVGEIKKDSEELGKRIDRLEAEIEERKAAGQSPDKYENLTFRCEELKKERELTENFRERAEDCLAYTKQSGFNVEIIRQESYNLLLKNDSGVLLKNGLYVLVALIICFGGIMSFEKQSNMKNTLKSTKRGRLRLVLNKAALVFVISLVLSAAVNMVHLYIISDSMGLNNLNASCQSVVMLRPFSFSLSIREYLIMMYVLRAFLTALIGIIIMSISAVCPNDMVSFGTAAALLIVPSVLNSAGLGFFFSFTRLITIVPR